MSKTPETTGPRKSPGQEDSGGLSLPPLPWLIGAAVVLAVLVGADAVIDFKPHFGVDGIFGFHAAYGLLSGLFVVIVAKIAGIFLKRTDTYYDAD
ncbi:hypothetical protein C882_4246 [Caenispirillum salinarum AK4]|uniref:Uncharacterized protein n=1 Tax=Caenispirillum salinarum AK4 TaxID=1238182 RepID=K9H1G3_9PROT|nr:hypothetical protein [Caenispirillum salinarum]EKV30909.1 hypothetical protein C882_4246 [Caenispirillum salinarum AK4]